MVTGYRVDVRYYGNKSIGVSDACCRVQASRYRSMAFINIESYALLAVVVARVFSDYPFLRVERVAQL